MSRTGSSLLSKKLPFCQILIPWPAQEEGHQKQISFFSNIPKAFLNQGPLQSTNEFVTDISNLKENLWNLCHSDVFVPMCQQWEQTVGSPFRVALVPPYHDWNENWFIAIVLWCYMGCIIEPCCPWRGTTNTNLYYIFGSNYSKNTSNGYQILQWEMHYSWC